VLIPQYADRSPFVDILRKRIAEASRVDIASAWARASGVGLIWKGLQGLLDRGGAVRAIVGVDRENTSIEGLEMLLRLSGDVQLWVRHNEASSIYHPKLYAFEAASDVHVYIGSNNMTGAGLSTNEEISAYLKEAKGGPLQASVGDYMTTLSDPSDNLCRPLDAALLKQMVDAGYILPEARLRGKSARSRLGSSSKTAPLFGFKAPKRIKVSKDVLPSLIEPSPGEPVADWKRVFVKLRLARGTQGQLPVAVARELRRRLGETAVDGPIPVMLKGHSVQRVISPTYAKRNPSIANTYKIEALQSVGDPVIEVQLVGSQVIVEQYDTSTPQGAAILRYVLDGLHTDPVQTVIKSKPTGTRAEIDAAAMGMTLYRYD
jgi:HKD family nuclease